MVKEKHASLWNIIVDVKSILKHDSRLPEVLSGIEVEFSLMTGKDQTWYLQKIKSSLFNRRL